MKKYLVFSFSILFFLLFVIIPVVSLFLSGFLGEPVNLFRYPLTDLINSLLEKFPLKNLCEFFQNQRYLKGIVNSFFLSITVTLIDIIIGVILAYAVARVHIPLKKIIFSFSFLPFILPTFIGALGVIIIFGKSGIITNIVKVLGLQRPLFNIYSYNGIAVVHIFTFFPFVFVPCYSMLKKLSFSSINEQANLLGASNLFSAFTLTIPLIRPGIARGALLIFIASFGDFGAPMVLLPAKGNLAIVNIYRGLLGIPSTWRDVALISSIMLAVIALFALLTSKFFIGKHDYQISIKKIQKKSIADKYTVLGFSILSLIILFIPIMILLSIILMSFTGSWGTEFLPYTYTLNYYLSIITSSPQPITNSYLLSLLTLSIAIPWALFIAYFSEKNRILGKFIIYPLSLLPFAIPGVILSIAFILVFNTKPLLLHNTLIILLLAFILKKSAFCIQTNRTSIFQLRNTLQESSSLLGAPKLFSFFKITLPFLTVGIISGAILVYISIMHDLSSTVLLSAPKWTPLSLYIFREIEAGRIFLACAYGVLLIFLTLIPTLIAYIMIRKLTKLTGIKLLY